MTPRYPAVPAIIALTPFLLLTSTNSLAESGLYAGGSVGSATVAVDVPGVNPGEVFAFDEDDFAYKLFAGYNFDLPAIDVGIEAAYFDLGAPSGDFQGESVEIEVNGLSAFGILGFDVGPLDVFAKAGMVSWDVEAVVSGSTAGDDDGTDPAYGVGARFMLGPVEIRGEYELFDLDADGTSGEDVYLLSLGLAFSF